MGTGVSLGTRLKRAALTYFVIFVRSTPPTPKHSCGRRRWPPRTDANPAAATARARGQTTLDPEVLATIRNHYRGATALGVSTKSEKIITEPCGYIAARPRCAARNLSQMSQFRRPGLI